MCRWTHISIVVADGPRRGMMIQQCMIVGPVTRNVFRPREDRGRDGDREVVSVDADLSTALCPEVWVIFFLQACGVNTNDQ